MLNKFPLWKNILVFLVIAVGFFYALPNLYGEDPALQVSGTGSTELTADDATKIQTFLENKNIQADYEFNGNSLLIRFKATSEQILAKDMVQDLMGERIYYCSESGSGHSSLDEITWHAAIKAWS